MRDAVLIVDDVELNRGILCEMLEGEYRTLEAQDGIEALEAMEAHRDEIAVVLLDLMMPRMGGLEVLETMARQHLLDRFPVLIITGETSPEIEDRCLASGAYDFIKKPFQPSLVLRRTRNAAALFTYKNHLEEQVALQTAQLTRQAEALRAKNAQLREMNEMTIELLSDIIEARNLESGTHVQRVRAFTRILGLRLMERCPEYGLDRQTVDVIALASMMHDVGKIMISDAILLKPGKLTPEEFDTIKQHTILGCEVLDHTSYMWEEDYYRYCLQICRYHHEKYDGRGYPEGLRGDGIPIAAQIVSIADCYDALTNERVYKKAFSPETSYEMMMGGECGVFNPKLMHCLEDCRAEFEAQVRNKENTAKIYTVLPNGKAEDT
jgi:putative two-component system response regulator